MGNLGNLWLWFVLFYFVLIFVLGLLFVFAAYLIKYTHHVKLIETVNVLYEHLNRNVRRKIYNEMYTDMYSEIGHISENIWEYDEWM